MSITIKPTILAIAIPALGAIFSASVQADEPPCPFYENRSGLCGYYHSEISPAEAFVDTVVKRGSWSDPQLRPVILDVRSTSEFKAGHPEHAFNVPFPNIFFTCKDVGPDPKDPNKLTVDGADGLTENDRVVDGVCVSTASTDLQDPEVFKSYVEKLIPNKATPIYTLCRTGVRSVAAANHLTDAGYTNVRNIWEGFVGINLTAPKKQEDGTVLVLPVDINHDGELTDEDKNGWRNHQALPFDTRLLPKLIYKPMAYLYQRD